MHPYVGGLEALFEKNMDVVQAAPMKKYMRDQFEYLGIKTPQRKALLKQFINEFGLPPINDLDMILHDLWELPQREFQYVAVGLLGKIDEQLPPEFIETVEYLIITKSWWDTVDSIAGGTVGTHFRRYPAIREKY